MVEGSIAVEPDVAVIRSSGVRALPVADEQLVRALYEEHAGPLLGYVRRLTGDPGRAEDVVQEALLRAWQHPQAFEPGRERSSVRGWLFTVARNLVVDGERARKARPREVSVIGEPSPKVDPRLDQVLLHWEMTDVLAALSAEHRAVVLELYYRDQSVSQAAQTLGIPEGTVKSRAHYALRALRNACEERGIAP